jgi:hypothetical protein
VDQRVIAGLAATLPVEVQQDLAEKPYRGSPEDARLAYLTDVVNAVREHALKTALPERLKTEVEKELARRMPKELEALQKKVLSQTVGGEPAPDTGSAGAPPVGEFVTPQEWNANKSNRQWIRANIDRVNRALAQGVALSP